jgi:putative transposase
MDSSRAWLSLCTASRVGRQGRRSVRLRGYDYASAGMYFVTVCARDRACVFGEVANGQVQLSELGETVNRCWVAVGDHFLEVTLDRWVIMPNHLHGILAVGGLRSSLQPVVGVRSRGACGPSPSSIGAIVGSFKAAVTKAHNDLRGRSGTTVWQRSYYEHVIRNERDLQRVRQYVEENPIRWELDPENPVRRQEGPTR